MLEKLLAVSIMSGRVLSKTAHASLQEVLDRSDVRG